MRRITALLIFLVTGLSFVTLAKADTPSDAPSILDTAAAICASGKPEVQAACNAAAASLASVVAQSLPQPNTATGGGAAFVGGAINTGEILGDPSPSALPPRDG